MQSDFTSGSGGGIKFVAQRSRYWFEVSMPGDLKGWGSKPEIFKKLEDAI